MARLLPYRGLAVEPRERSQLSSPLSGVQLVTRREEVAVTNKKEISNLNVRLTVATTALGLLDALAKLAEIIRTLVR